MSPTDEFWGGMYENGSWNGIIGMLQRREADLSISTITITPSRMNIVDFSLPYDYETVHIMTRAGGLADLSNVLFYVKPFEPGVWLGIFLSLTFYTIIHWFLRKRGEIENRYSGICEIVFHLFGILLKQDDKKYFSMCNSRGRRMLFITWLSSCLFFGLFYSSMLTTTTSLGPRTSEIDSLADLVNAVLFRNFKVLLLNGTSSEERITVSKDKDLKTILKNSKSDKELPSLIPHENQASISTKRTLMNLLAKMDVESRSGYRLSSEYLFLEFIGVAYGKSFPYKEQFNVVLLGFQETGLIGKWISDHNMGRIPPVAYRSDNSFDLKKCANVFYGLFYGILISVLILIGEITKTSIDKIWKYPEILI